MEERKNENGERAARNTYGSNVGDVQVAPGREYVRQITYYDALLYTNTNAYRGPVSVYGHRHAR